MVGVAQVEEEDSRVVEVDLLEEDLVGMVVEDSVEVEEVDLGEEGVVVGVLGAISIKFDRCTERVLVEYRAQYTARNYTLSSTRSELYFL